MLFNKSNSLSIINITTKVSKNNLLPDIFIFFKIVLWLVLFRETV